MPASIPCQGGLGGLRGIDAGKSHPNLLGTVGDRDGVAITY